MGDVVTLDIRDDGVGFVPPTSTAPRGVGFGSAGCASGPTAWPAPCRSSRSQAEGPPSRPACPRSPAHDRRRPREPDPDADRRRPSGRSRRIARHVPGDPDFEVVGEAADGAEAVRLAGELEPDVVLMDLHMPGVDGGTAIQQLADRGSRARVLVLTTYDTDARRGSGPRGWRHRLHPERCTTGGARARHSVGRTRLDRCSLRRSRRGS